MEKEIWKEISDTHFRYEVSNLGRVRSFVFDEEGRIIKPKIHKNGYLSVKLNWKSGYRMELLHRVVGKAFIPNPYNKKCVDHINRDRSDCRVSNLQWASHKENVQKDQAFPIECTHSTGLRHVALGTRDAEVITGVPRMNIVRAIKKGTATITEWTFKRI